MINISRPSRLPMSDMKQLIFIVLSLLYSFSAMAADFGIEGMNSKEFSVGIFIFLIFSIVVFVVIIFVYMLQGKSRLKLGEKIMFFWIMLGVIAAVIFGATQLLHGFLI